MFIKHTALKLALSRRETMAKSQTVLIYHFQMKTVVLFVSRNVFTLRVRLNL